MATRQCQEHNDIGSQDEGTRLDIQQKNATPTLADDTAGCTDHSTAKLEDDPGNLLSGEIQFGVGDPQAATKTKRHYALPPTRARSSSAARPMTTMLGSITRTTQESAHLTDKRTTSMHPQAPHAHL
ncbi:hypothetical protein BGZ73_003633 [Actinomortierella ambigua]|nr:hypothetical protein BGZ73_003633 [Actinomortierella ambigua]